MLLRSVTVVDSASPYHGQTVDIRVADGEILAIDTSLAAQNQEEVYSYDQAFASPGFVDIGAYLGDPGYEEREDVGSITRAARAGGYVSLAVLPYADPVRQSVTDLRYLQQHSDAEGIDLLPIAALSEATTGRDLTQMMELAEAGAVAFSDGPEHPASGSLLKRGLQYALAFGGTIIDTPRSSDLVSDGQMHEGAVSVSLGLPGIPSISETIALQRSLSLLDYTGGSLIAHLISTAEGLQLIQDHRELQRGGHIACTVAAHNLSFTDAELATFDTNFKLSPPLRGDTDRQQLRQGLLDGRIEAVVSNHFARHAEEKQLEFTYAAFGARGLETCFRQLLEWIDGMQELSSVVAALTTGPRRLLSLPPLTIERGAKAQLTIYTTAGSGEITTDDLVGKTKNSPLLGRHLPGRILATYNSNRLWTSA